MVQGDSGGIELPVIESPTPRDHAHNRPQPEESLKIDKQQADEARRLVGEDMERLGRDKASAMVKPAPKR